MDLGISARSTKGITVSSVDHCRPSKGRTLSTDLANLFTAFPHSLLSLPAFTFACFTNELRGNKVSLAEGAGSVSPSGRGGAVPAS